MKTCKDCTYFVNGQYCYLNPKPVTIMTRLDKELGDHWCGQLKEAAPPQSELESAIEKAGKTKYTLYEVQEDGTSKPIRTFESSDRVEPLKRLNIWKQQQDLKQPKTISNAEIGSSEIFYGGKRGGSMKDASRKLNQPDDELRDYTLNRLKELDKEYET